MGRHTTRRLRGRGSDAAHVLHNIIRRVTDVLVARVSGSTGNARKAQATGYVDPDDPDHPEPFDDVEVFGVPGFISRPSSAEGIIAHVGGSYDHPVMVAARSDADGLLELADGEAAMLTETGTAVMINAQGKILLGDIRMHAPGGFTPLDGVATGLTVDSWGVPLGSMASNVSVTVFATKV